MKIYWLVLSVIVLSIISSCAYIQKKVDIFSINGLQNEIIEDFQPGDPKSLKKYLDSLDLEKDTKPLFQNEIITSRRTNWNLDDEVSLPVTEEKISFPSLLNNFIPNDSARFYIYRIASLKNSKTILWVPGFGVSDKAFYFIKKFFIEELNHGYNVVVYIPPYHLDRKLPGKNDGDGFFSSNMQKNVIVNFEALREIRTITLYLENQGVSEINAWAGSMGASSLLLSSKFTDYKNISLMIPVFDWQKVIYDNIHFKETINKLLEQGIDSLLIKESLKKISPVGYDIDYASENIFIQYAKYDQLNSGKNIREFAKNNGISKLKTYNTSHATILFSKRLYADYKLYLDSIASTEPKTSFIKLMKARSF